MNKQALVFTDLDGTLLDHHTYSFEPALPMLKKLKDTDIPVIANTSKTFAELQSIREKVGLTAPFIIENGAAVYIPKTVFPIQPKETIEKNDFWIKQFSPPVSHWLALLSRIEESFSGEFTHFSKMTTLQISQATGLSEEAAKLAASREYGEPILWLGSDASKQLFIQALEELGASPLQGGRFLHLSGQCDKGQALVWLQQEYQKHSIDPQGERQDCISIALGDGHNDIAMLEAADIAVRILSPVNPPPNLSRTNNVFTSEQIGPSGWSECLNNILFYS